MITQVEIEGAIVQVKKATKKAYESAYTLEMSKRDLDIAKARAISKGVEGKNAEERKANLEISIKPRKKDLETAQESYNESKLNAEIAQLELTRIKLTIRLMELVKK